MKDIEQEQNANDVDANIFEEPLCDTRESTPRVAKQSNLSKKRNRSGDALLSVVTHMADTISKAYPSDTTKASAEEIFTELSKVTDLEESELLQAYDILTGDSRKYESFKALPSALRKAWVLMQIKK